MADQTELNCLLVENLADLEAAGHQIDDQITPIIVAGMSDLVAALCTQTGWEGEWLDLDEMWFAPDSWVEPEGSDGAYMCKFEYRSEGADGDDWFALSALTGDGRLAGGLYWSRSYLNRSIAWSRLVAANADVVGELERAGLAYDKRLRTFFVPIKLDRAALVAGLRDGSLDDSLQPFAAALESARLAVPLLKPFVEALHEEALK